MYPGLDKTTATFLAAVEGRDLAGMRRLMAADAIVAWDGGSCHPGDLEDWLARFLPHGRTELLPFNATFHGADRMVTVIVSVLDDTADHPASRFQTAWTITLDNEKIHRLRIGSATPALLPDAILAFIRAMNTCSLDALLDTFADDALVNDQLRDYWGKPAIAEWAAREIIADRIAMTVIKVVAHYGTIIINANIDGDFDKRGLPDPLVLAFYFSAHDDKIVQLIILRNMNDF